jgi:hypothetical protein
MPRPKNGSVDKTRMADVSNQTVAFTMRIPQVMADALTIHSRLLRRVSRQVLLEDIVTCWLHTATDWKDPIFSRMVTERTIVPDTPERYPGYLTSIGFAPAVRVAAAIDAKEIPSTPREIE